MSDIEEYDEDLELEEGEEDVADETNRQAAYQEAVTELAKGIALGAVPFLGQAIDVYDTIESAIRVHQSDTPESKETAQFDLVLAIIGWVPGPGDGVKKSLRLVNRNPERFAPVLFDFLRFVLEECGIRTSPEELLAKIFNAQALQSQIDEIIAGVKDSSAFNALPRSVQIAILDILVVARDNFPSLLGIVERRLLKWRGKQRNNSAMTGESRKPAESNKPEGKAQDATDGKDSPGASSHNKVDNQKTRKFSIHDVTNAMLGVAGEHIADYYCYETLKWGSGWEAHDMGGDGVWNSGNPSTVIPGKLSRGGSPKDIHKLFKLTDPSFGTGIDAVWCANGCSNNDGKPFAIVDAKASVSRKKKKPKYMGKPGNTRKPGISSLLEGSGSGHNRMVQMSHEWIRKNIDRSVPPSVARKIKAPVNGAAYARHIIYLPPYFESLLSHLSSAMIGGEEAHDQHDGIHYSESDVGRFVNKAKKRERKNYPGSLSLRDE